MKPWKIISLAAVLAMAAGAAQAADVGKLAPPFSIRTFDGQKVTSEDLKGKVVVINYWATWCTPCKAEMIAFDAYVRAHPQADLKIYSIATEDSVPPVYLKKLAAALAFPLGRHLDGRGYGVMKGVPTSYVIDRAGIVRHAAPGAFDEESFDDLVGPLLAQAAPAQQVAASDK